MAINLPLIDFLMQTTTHLLFQLFTSYFINTTIRFFYNKKNSEGPQVLLSIIIRYINGVGVEKHEGRVEIRPGLKRFNTKAGVYNTNWCKLNH